MWGRRRLVLEWGLGHARMVRGEGGSWWKRVMWKVLLVLSWLERERVRLENGDESGGGGREGGFAV